MTDMKTYKSLFVCFAVAVLAASCAKEVSDPVRTSGPVPEGWTRVVFGAGLQAPQEGITKTSLAGDGATVEWAEGDRVDIVWSAEGKTVGDVSASESTIAAAVESAETYYAAYPAGGVTEFRPGLGEGADTLVVKIPDEVDGSFGAANYQVAKTSSSAMDFAFKNIAGVVKVTVTEDAARTVRICANRNVKLGGKAFISFDPVSGAPSVDSVASGTNVVNIRISGAGTYYAPVLAREDWVGGFGIQYLDADGKPIGTALTSKDVSWVPRKLMGISGIEAQFQPGDFYFKADGIGKGTSWDDAGGSALLVELLNKGANYGVTNTWRIQGKTFYMAAGTYDLSNPNGATDSLTFRGGELNLTVKGGYPASASGTDLTGRDVDANKTVWTAANPGSGSYPRVMYTALDTRFGETVFDGIHVEGLTADKFNQRGAFIYVNAAGTGTLRFKDCRFTGNTIGSYGLVDMNMNKGDANRMVFEGCIFKNNTSTRESTPGGACIVGESETRVDIIDCTFEGNSCDGGPGGAVYSAGKLYISGNTVFKGNHALKGGALVANELDCEDATFTENYCVVANGNVGGGAFTNFYAAGTSYSSAFSGDVLFRNCTFSKNATRAPTATSGTYGRGGAINCGGTGKLTIIGGTFSENSCYGNGGGAIYYARSSAGAIGDVFISGVTFSKNACASAASNTAGADISAKNAKRFLISNCSFLESEMMGGTTFDKNHGMSIYIPSGAATFVGLFGCTFFGQKPTTKYGATSVVDLSVPSAIANCTMVATERTAHGVLSTAGAGVVKCMNNIILNKGASNDFAIGNVGSVVSGGYNIYGSLVKESVFTPQTSDLSADIGTVFGTPSLNASNQLVPAIYSSLPSVSADAVKTWIASEDADFHAWLSEIGAYPAATSWKAGAYQE